MHIKNKRKTGGEGPPVFLCFAWRLARKVVGSQDRNFAALIRIDSDRKLYRVILAAIKRTFFPFLVPLFVFSPSSFSDCSSSSR